MHGRGEEESDNQGNERWGGVTVRRERRGKKEFCVQSYLRNTEKTEAHVENV